MKMNSQEANVFAPSKSVVRESKGCANTFQSSTLQTRRRFIFKHLTRLSFLSLSPPTRELGERRHSKSLHTHISRLRRRALSHNLGYCCARLWMWVRNNRRKCSDNIKGCHILRFALIQREPRFFDSLALTRKKWQLTKARSRLNFICCADLFNSLLHAHTHSLTLRHRQRFW